MGTNTPETSSLRRLMRKRGLDNLPDADWASVDDIGRGSIEGFIQLHEGETRTERSTGRLRLHGVMVEQHRADLDDVSKVGIAWQRAVNAVGAALEGVRSATGRLNADITSRLQLQLVAAPAPGSLVLHVEPKANPLGEVDGAHGQRELFGDRRPLADRASERLIALCGALANAHLKDDEANAVQLLELGPRTARAVSSLASVLSSASFDLDAAWEEPGHPTLAMTMNSSQARRVKQFVEGRHLDTEDITVVGIAHTVSDVDRWVIEVDGVNEKFDAADVPRELWRGKFRVGDEVHLRVRVTPNERPDGTTRFHRNVLDLLQVIPVEDPDEPASS